MSYDDSKEPKDLVIALPENEELMAARMSADQLGEMVQEIGGKVSGSRALGVPAVRLKGNRAVARSARVDAGAIDDPGGWIKTIWRRFC